MLTKLLGSSLLESPPINSEFTELLTVFNKNSKCSSLEELETLCFLSRKKYDILDKKLKMVSLGSINRELVNAKHAVTKLISVEDDFV